MSHGAARAAGQVPDAASADSAQLGQQLGVVELEVVDHRGDLEPGQRGAGAEVGQERGVGGVAAGGDPQQALPRGELGGVDDLPLPSTSASATAWNSIGLSPGA